MLEFKICLRFIFSFYISTVIKCRFWCALLIVMVVLVIIIIIIIIVHICCKVVAVSVTSNVMITLH